ncbi:MAG: DUF3592 domain-containing protein [Alphaproteobacteria bacterium]|nr:DUF3592 domain-containing protein [Alphaproteobacteria bacterium]
MALFSKSFKQRLTGGFLLVGGVCLTIAGIWFLVATTDFVRHAERAPGQVMEVVGERGARGSKLYYPMVRYLPHDRGSSTVFKAKPGLWPSPFSVGDTVTVAYRADDPDGAKIVSFWTLWFLPIVLILFGLGCLFAGRHTLNKPV